VALKEFESANKRQAERKGSKKKQKKATTNTEIAFKPFQSLEFLVRDWQNFEGELCVCV
jgi:hypothetical protein